MAREEKSLLLVRRAVESLREVPDDAERARVATQLLDALLAANAEVKAVRVDAVIALNNAGFGYGAIAKALGLTKARVQQLVNDMSTPRRPGTIERDLSTAAADLRAKGATDQDIVTTLIPQIRARRSGVSIAPENLAAAMGVTDIALVKKALAVPVTATE